MADSSFLMHVTHTDILEILIQLPLPTVVISHEHPPLTNLLNIIIQLGLASIMPSRSSRRKKISELSSGSQ